MNEFALDLGRIRTAARSDMAKGPVTEVYGADVKRVIDVLNEVLATELVCVLRYRRHYFTAQGVHGPTVAAEFLEHANDEQHHADLAAERIIQLGGEPDFSPAVLVERSHTEYVPGHGLRNMVEEDLIAERIAISTYTDVSSNSSWPTRKSTPTTCAVSSTASPTDARSHRDLRPRVPVTPQRDWSAGVRRLAAHAA